MRKKSKEPEKRSIHPPQRDRAFNLRELVKKTPSASPPPLTNDGGESGTVANKPPKHKPTTNSSHIEDNKLKIARLSTLVDDLRFFDVNTIQRRSDPKAKMLADKINETLADIFERDSPEYDDNCVWSLDTLPITIGGAWYPLPEVREAYRKGINSVVAKLTKLIDRLEKDSAGPKGREVAGNGTDTPPAQTKTEKISLLTIRGRLRNRQPLSVQTEDGDVAESFLPPPSIENKASHSLHGDGAPTHTFVASEPIAEGAGDHSRIPLSNDVSQPLLAEVESTPPIPDKLTLAESSHDGDASLPYPEEEERCQIRLGPQSTKDVSSQGPVDHPVSPRAMEGAVTPDPEQAQPDREGLAPPPAETSPGSLNEPILLENLEKKLLALEAEDPLKSDARETDTLIAKKGTTLDTLLVKIRELQLSESGQDSLEANASPGSEEEQLFIDGDHPSVVNAPHRPVREIDSHDSAVLKQTARCDEGHATNTDDRILPEAPFVEEFDKAFSEQQVEKVDPIPTERSKVAQDGVQAFCQADVCFPELVPPDHWEGNLESWSTDDFVDHALDTYPVLQEEEGIIWCVPDPLSKETAQSFTFNADKSPSEAESPCLPRAMTFDAAPGSVFGEGEGHYGHVSEATPYNDDDLFEFVQSTLTCASDVEAAPTFRSSPTQSPLILPNDDVPPYLARNQLLIHSPDVHASFPICDAVSTTLGLVVVPEDGLQDIADQKEIQPQELDGMTIEALDVQSAAIAYQGLAPARLTWDDGTSQEFATDLTPGALPWPISWESHNAWHPEGEITLTSPSGLIEGETPAPPLDSDMVLFSKIEYSSLMAEDGVEALLYGGDLTSGYLPLPHRYIDEPINIFYNTGFQEPIEIGHPFLNGETATGESREPFVQTQPMVSSEIEHTNLDDKTRTREAPEALQEEEVHIGSPQQDKDGGYRTIHNADTRNIRCISSDKLPKQEIPFSDPSIEAPLQVPAEELVTEPERDESRSNTDGHLSTPKSGHATHSPFAGHDRAGCKSAERRTGPQVEDAHIGRLRDRLADLESFDVKTIKDRFDPRVKALGESINSTLADIFGQNTPTYWQHAIPSLDTLPAVVGGPKLSHHEIVKVYQKGIDDAAAKVRSILETLERKREGSSANRSLAIQQQSISPTAHMKKELPTFTSRPRPSEHLRPFVPDASPKGHATHSPFAGHDRAGCKSAERRTGPQVEDVHIGRLRDRLADLESFDVKTIKDRFDPRVKALGESINSTLADIFGQNTPTYWQHAIPSLDTLPAVVGGPKLSHHEIVKVYQKGINDAAAKLRSILETLERKREGSSANKSTSKGALTHPLQVGGRQVFRNPGYYSDRP